MGALLVIPEQWKRTELCAELERRGHDVVAVAGLTELEQMDDGPTGVLLIDQKTLEGRSLLTSEALRRRYPRAPLVLLSSWNQQPPPGTWSAVISRPTNIGHIAARLDELLRIAHFVKHIAS